MIRLDASQVALLERLGKSPDGQQLLALIKKTQDEVNEQLRTLTGENLYRAQGEATAWHDLAKKLNPPFAASPRDTPRRITHSSIGMDS